MALYRVRWVCPSRSKVLFRDFHSKRDAEAFRALPRANPTLLERLPC